MIGVKTTMPKSCADCYVRMECRTYHTWLTSSPPLPMPKPGPDTDACMLVDLEKWEDDGK